MKLRVTERNATVFYAVIQCLYYMVMALIYGYTSAFLLYKGFTNTQIGTTLGITNILLACLQPFLAVFLQKTGIRLSTFMAIGFMVFMVLAAIMLVCPMGIIGVMLVMILLYLIPASMYASLQSMYLGYLDHGIRINFSLARGAGSASYAISCLMAGFLIRVLTPKWLPAMYLIPSIVLMAALLLFRAPNPAATPAMPGSTKKASSLRLREYPNFYLFMAGVTALSVTSSFIGTYLLQIISRIGGTSSDLGIAIAIGTVTELPAMILYSVIHRKVGNHRLLVFSCWMWALKNLMLILSPNIYAIYATQLLHFIGFAIYIPASARYLTYAIPRTEYLKGQALLGSAGTIGDLVASFGGGLLIDYVGMDKALWIMQIFSAIGVILFSTAVLRSAKHEPQI